MKLRKLKKEKQRALRHWINGDCAMTLKEWIDRWLTVR